MFHAPIDVSFTQSDADAVDRALGRVAFDRHGTILRVNERFLELYDYRDLDLVGRNRSIFAGATSDTAIVKEALATGRMQTADVQQLKRDGTPIWIEAQYIPVADGEEIILLVRDITARRLRNADAAGQIAAINTSQAVIHFAVDGTILDANDKFLAATGYARDEIVGRHHRMFVEAEEAASADYAAFWEGLRAGTHTSGEYRRLHRDGHAIWLRATYNPILDLDGRPFKIVKYAVDVTEQKLQDADFRGQIAAIDVSQCVVTFTPDGTILDANARFLDAVGYTMAELEGRHHRIFVDPAHAHGLEYDIFWADLAAGRHRSGEMRRIGKDGQDVWFQATYSPVLDHDGRPVKIVKHATAITREKLRQADHQGQIAAMHRSQAVVSFAPDGTILDANDKFLALTGYRLSQVRGRHHAMFVSEEERASDAYVAFWSDLAGGAYKSGEFKRICRDGRETWIRASYNPIFDMNGRVFKVVKNAVDVTMQKLRQADYEGQITAIHKSQSVASFDLDGNVLDANANFLAMTGYAADEVIGRHHSIFVDPAHADSDGYRALWEALRAGQHLSSKFRRIARDGSEIWIQATYNPIFDLNGQPYKIVKIATDITADVSLAADLARAQREVQHDLATGLPNRLGLRRFLREALSATDSTLALLYLDLDHFKPINDSFGHDVGDFVLKTVAKRLGEELGEGQIAARIGGDEFVVAATQLDRAAVVELAERLIASVSAPIAFGDRRLAVGLSIGIALTPEDTLDEDELFRFADVALYRSKGKERGTYTFYAEDHAETAEVERHMAHDLRIAIKAGDLVLACSPCLGDDGGVLKVEVRPEWNHSTLGRLPLERFLRVAEQSGLIVPLGDWTMREACRLARGGGHELVSIPVYPRQLMGSDVPGQLALALRESGLPLERVELRIERGSSYVNPASLRDDLAKLSAVGVRVIGTSFLVPEDALAAKGVWPVDELIVDARLRAILRRLSPEVALEIDTVVAQDAETDLGGGTRVLQIDPQHRLNLAVAAKPSVCDFGL